MTGKLATIAIGGNSLITDPKKPDIPHQWDAVREYYKSGPYRKALRPVDHLNPMVCGYCSLRQPFFEQAPMSGRFGTTQFQELYAAFFRVFGEALGDPKKSG